MGPSQLEILIVGVIVGFLAAKLFAAIQPARKSSSRAGKTES
jgi:hypothetical protein